jgi:hypothetical protein
MRDHSAEGRRLPWHRIEPNNEQHLGQRLRSLPPMNGRLSIPVLPDGPREPGPSVPNVQARHSRLAKAISPATATPALDPDGERRRYVRPWHKYEKARTAACEASRTNPEDSRRPLPHRNVESTRCLGKKSVTTKNRTARACRSPIGRPIVATELQASGLAVFSGVRAWMACGRYGTTTVFPPAPVILVAAEPLNLVACTSSGLVSAPLAKILMPSKS